MGERSDPHTPRKPGADSRTWLRAVVAGYLVYLGYSLIREQLKGSSAMVPWFAWACGLLFVVSGLAFGWYTWKTWRAASEAAPPEEEQKEDDQPEG